MSPDSINLAEKAMTLHQSVLPGHTKIYHSASSPFLWFQSFSEMFIAIHENKMFGKCWHMQPPGDTQCIYHIKGSESYLMTISFKFLKIILIDLELFFNETPLNISQDTLSWLKAWEWSPSPKLTIKSGMRVSSFTSHLCDLSTASSLPTSFNTPNWLNGNNSSFHCHLKDMWLGQDFFVVVYLFWVSVSLFAKQMQQYPSSR